MLLNSPNALSSTPLFWMAPASVWSVSPCKEIKGRCRRGEAEWGEGGLGGKEGKESLLKLEEGLLGRPMGRPMRQSPGRGAANRVEEKGRAQEGSKERRGGEEKRLPASCGSRVRFPPAPLLFLFLFKTHELATGKSHGARMKAVAPHAHFFL